MQQESTVIYDVAIVGYGPIGATLANALGQMGHHVVVFEREPSVYHMPRASHLDAEVMRYYQALGLAEQMEKILIGAKGYNFLNEKGEVLLRLAKPEGRNEIHGWNNHYRFYQPRLETLLREGVARFANVEVFLNHDVVALEEQDQFVQLSVHNRVAGSDHVYKAKFVIGCDGGRSTVRKYMGVKMYDIGLRQKWLVIDVKLTQPVDLPKIGIQYCEPSRPTTFVPMIGDYDRFRWEMMLMPGETDEEMEQPEKVWSLLSRWMRSDQGILERAAVYVFHSVIAQEWRKGRILLAGDSAHQTPPFLGQGMCAGIRDVANLSWKLDLVLRGKANIRLLDTYMSERTYHVRKFIDMATDLGRIITVTDRKEAEERDRRLLAGEPQTWIQPDPPLGAGIFLASHPLAGSAFPQPKLQDGRRMDDVIGQKFAIIATPSVLADVSEDIRAVWEELDLVVISDEGEEFRRICEQQQAQAFVLRPDRYVYSATSDAKALERMMRQLHHDVLSAYIY